jgi:REP element-mobilizing transposase RayT
VYLDEYIIMPNHIHGILVINNQNVGAKDFSPLQLPDITKFQSPSKSIGSIIRGFKIGVTKWSKKNTDKYIIWQRNYYEHVIRDDSDLNNIRTYIINNPLKWSEDKYLT